MTADLNAILRERFGYTAFRAHQEEVCSAVAAGQDALLVMPTGSGKSLCYQLPGIARGGTTLVVSPLIALMEDQTAKLRERGLRAERIHSGRGREDSRAACRAYLDGGLDFLAIAPERLSVPGFPEMLARRKPVLIAVDEAHCISHWGHDFRPDYRLLGGRLPLLRPAPVLALTATATVRVQDDILEQLHMARARRFIHGFRRDNLAIEVAQVPRGEREDRALKVVLESARRPALVYVPSRKTAEDLAERLAKRGLAAAPYHAGLDSGTRGRTQLAFQAGELEVVVATIAFGMGIDKANVRTVVHLGLPSSVEGYYQEIGRAGRDGLPARALLFYSWADRKLHEHFLERDFPPREKLEDIVSKVPGSGIARDALASACRGAFEDEDTMESALGKLWVHGAITIDPSDTVHRADGPWRESYDAIRAHRIEQLELVQGFAQSSGCRMARLIRHFGDTRDTRPCGICDECQPQECVARRLREPTQAERDVSEQILDVLEQEDGLAVGTLLRNVSVPAQFERSDFERVLAGLERAGAIALREDEFEKDGRTIRYRRADLLTGARDALAALLVEPQVAPSPTGRKRAPKKRTPGSRTTATRTSSDERRDPSPENSDPDLRPEERDLEQRLRAWRAETARAQQKPAFIILTNRTLHEIVRTKPSTCEELLEVHGAGPKLVDLHGSAILELVRG